MRWRDSARRLASPLVRAGRVRRRLRRDAPHLRPGLWVVANDRLARHWRTGRLPRHLVTSKIRAVDPTSPVRTRVARRTSHLASAIARAPLSLVWVPRRAMTPEAATTSGYPIATWGSDTGRAVLVDPVAMTVLHVHHGDDVPTAAHLDLRRRFSRNVPSPDFTIVDDPSLLGEEYVAGRLFSEVSRDERVTAFAALVRGYAGLVATEGAGSAAEAIERSLAFAAQAALPRELEVLLDAHGRRFAAAAARWPLVPSHGDVASYNVVLRGSEPVLIDFESLAPRAFFYDPMLFVLRETLQGRPDLLEAVHAGKTDDALAQLWTAAGLDPREDDPLGALVAAVLLRASEGAADPVGFASVARRYWPALAAANDANAASV